MGTRRVFLQTTAALSGMTLVGGAGWAAAAPAPQATPLYKVIGDSRFEESGAYLREAERLGLAVAMTNGDVTRLWFEDLAPRWAKGPAAIAGLTGHGALFCLERWAWEAGMHVVYRADHRRLSDGGAVHQVVAADAVSAKARLQEAAELYPREAARLADQCAFPPFKVLNHPGVQCGPTDLEPLVSWVIAPDERA